ncbi:MAG TPA: DUF2752 domain-containing protein [Sphingobacteriaceae bacterium]
MRPRFPAELLCWITALILLFFAANDSVAHFTLCPLSQLGLEWCPGCGLGRSVGALLHGDLVASLRFHWFGLPALMILFFRIVQLFRNFVLTLVVS